MATTFSWSSRVASIFPASRRVGAAVPLRAGCMEYRNLERGRTTLGERKIDAVLDLRHRLGASAEFRIFSGQGYIARMGAGFSAAVVGCVHLYTGRGRNSLQTQSEKWHGCFAHRSIRHCRSEQVRGGWLERG